jgi:abortive infection AbiH-like protein
LPNLFIIGNGFDVAHKLKTKYIHFYNYLSKKYPEAKGEELIIPEYHMAPDGGDYYDDNQIVDFIKCLINIAEDGAEWRKVEDSVGKLDLSLCVDEVEEVYGRDGDLDAWKTAYNYEDAASHIVYPVQSITRFFEDWISEIKISKWKKKIPDFDKLIDRKNDYFLTFNYTDTLEIVYKTQHVCHIHGRQGEELYFGHGVDFDYYEDAHVPIGTESFFQNIHNHLKKNTSKALNSHQGFFNNLIDVSNIYSYGFSFSDVDLIYIREICNKIDTKNVLWYLSDFNDISERQEYINKINSCGFVGRFDLYHIDNPYYPYKH